MTVAALEGVTVRRGARAVLEGASFRVDRGERIALLGPNGAGKTTLLRVLAGLERPDSGAVAPLSAGVGYVPQAYANGLFPWFSVLRNVALPRLVPGISDALDVARALCARILPGVDLERRAGRLSGGEAQAVALARALAAPGDLVLADEPFSALSTALRARVLGVLGEELRGRALVLVTHSAADARELCDRTFEMQDGRPVELEPPRRLT